MNYRIGDKIRIVDTMVGANWNELMHKWLGKIMTVRDFDEEEQCYFMVEDREEHSYKGWCWGDHMIEGLADEAVNKMADIAAMFNMKLEEEFVIKDVFSNPYRFCEKGLYDNNDFISRSMFSRLISGEVVIDETQWKPKHGGEIFYVRPDGSIGRTYLDSQYVYDRALLMSGNCFRTYSIAELNKEALEKSGMKHLNKTLEKKEE